MNEEYLKGLTKEELIEIIFDETTCTHQLLNNWNELNKFIDKRIKEVQEDINVFEEDLYNDYERNYVELKCLTKDIARLEDIQEKMQELEGNNDSKRDV